jgi:hypothetical protein
MARADRSAKRGIGSSIFGLINPIRDPSLLIAIILTVIEEGGNSNPPYMWALFGLLNWIAVKAVIWLLVNFVFSFVYLLRKTGWIIRNPRLSWRLLDALGTEEIIIGGLRPDMFATEDGALHEGQLGLAALGVPGYGAIDGAYGGNGGNGNNGYDPYARQPQIAQRYDVRSAEMQELLSSYAGVIGDWMAYTEEKWRAVSDSQLGWKPLRGRWNGWEEIYRDAYGRDERGFNPNDPMLRRFENAQTKGSAASSVACFLHDMEQLRQALVQMEGGDPMSAGGGPRGAGGQQGPISQRTGKSPIIRNPMIVDAD